jgi:Ca2+-transporting ATPase
MKPTPQDKLSGLSDAEAELSFSTHGENILPSAKPKSAFAIASQTMREPMFTLLLACAGLYWWLGDQAEAAMLSAGVVGVIVLTFVQERRAEKTLEALRDLSSPRALVIRGGVRRRVSGRDVVPGDVVVLVEGDRVPADGEVISSSSLRVDESLLTGESAPVSKISRADAVEDGAAADSFSHRVFSGAMVVQGDGYAVVTATGARTRIGQIGTAIKGVVPPPSRVMVEVRSVVRWVALFSVLTSLVIMTIAVVGGKPVVDSVLMGLTFALGTVPEEFPVVLTIFMAIGAWRISQKNVLTRQMTAIESLGSATFLCVDKTGTLTENKMKVSCVWTHSHGFEDIAAGKHSQSASALELCKQAAWACAPNSLDPVDVATLQLCDSLKLPRPSVDSLVKALPMIRPILAVGCQWHFAIDDLWLAIKGAPESVLTLCRADEKMRQSVMSAVEHLAQRGQRVLAVASVSTKVEINHLNDVVPIFSGLITYEDPLRENVRQAVHDCHTAGIKVLMMTGDYPVTAMAVARDAGVLLSNGVLTGVDIDVMSDQVLAERLATVRVMARMVPEHKLRVVKALQAAGEVVAMTGDGVNDAPALRAADIGVAMGERGTDVAREASSLVLINDQFASIVDAIRLGRRVFSNLQTAMTYIIAIHIPVAGLALLPVFWGTPAILLPMHVALLQLMIDPVCSIVFEAEPEAPDLMSRRPRPASARVFSAGVLIQGFMAGGAALIIVIFINQRILREVGQADHARAVGFACLIMINIALMTCLRPGSSKVTLMGLVRNRTLFWAAFALLALMAVIFYVDPIARALHFIPPHPKDLLSACGIGVICAVVFALLRFIPVGRSEIQSMNSSHGAHKGANV